MRKRRLGRKSEELQQDMGWINMRALWHAANEEEKTMFCAKGRNDYSN